MYEQDFDLEELLKHIDLDLDPIDQYDEWELEEMLEWQELEKDDADFISIDNYKEGY